MDDANIKRPKSLLVGTYCGLNKGDRLMQEVAGYILQQRFKMQVTLLTPFPKIDEQLYSSIKIRKSLRRNLIYSFLRSILLYLFPVAATSWMTKFDQELKEYDEADLVVDLSGDMLTEDYGIHVAISHSFPLLTSILTKKDFVVVGQSIGKFVLLKSYYKWILSKAIFITARDPITYDYLRGLGLSNVHETSDLGFLLQKESYPFKKDDGKKYIGVVPSALIANKFAKDGQSINRLIDILNEASMHHSVKYVLIPHVNSPKAKYSDESVCAQIAQGLTTESMILDSDLSPGKVKYVISLMDGMLSYRMHAAIAALDSEVPCLVVSYSHKTVGLYQKFGISDWLVGLNCDSSLAEKMGLLLSGGYKYPESFCEKLKRERELSMENFTLLEKL